ncbi:MAG: VPLPA-CTERM sorting domain-containing protein [Geobacteraceae bacterium]|nr:VPLPA-CTERM sorting domain-containing protein [Geobacteraceae bacterium]
MKKLIVCWTLLLVFSMAGTAGASLVTFSETFLGDTGDGSLLTIDKQTYTFLFDLTATGTAANYYQLSVDGAKTLPTTDATGFVPGAYTITSAVLYYTFYDTDNPKDSALVKTEATDGNLTIGNYQNSSKLDLKNGQTSQSFTYNFTPADFTWLNDGKLILTINSSDNIQLDQLRLEVQGTTLPVPLPKAAWFLGTSLIGMVAISRFRVRFRFAD